MTQLLTKIIADFSTTLTTKTAVGATTGTLTSGLDGDGIQLPTATYGFTIDRNNANKEYFTATLTGANLTSIKTVTRGTGVGTSGLVKTHRKGAEVIISDWVAMKRMLDILDGTTSLDATTPIGYDGTATISTANQFATKAYVDGVSIAGAADATTTTKGITKMSVAPVSATEPIAVGDNDPRVPSANPTTLFAPIGLLPGMVTPYAGSSAPSGWLICDGSAINRTTYSTLFGVTSTTYGIGDGSTTFNIPDLRSRLPIGAGTGTKVATFSSRASNIITVTGLSNASNNEFQTGQAVLYSAPSGAMTGLTHNTTYYVVRVTNTTFSLATTLANAQNGTVIALSSDGTGTQTFTQTLTARTSGDTGGEENHAMSSIELLAHTHTYSGAYNNAGTGAGYATYSLGVNTSSTGGNTAMNNMQPFVVLNYIIKY